MYKPLLYHAKIRKAKKTPEKGLVFVFKASKQEQTNTSTSRPRNTEKEYKKRLSDYPKSLDKKPRRRGSVVVLFFLAAFLTASTNRCSISSGM